MAPLSPEMEKFLEERAKTHMATPERLAEMALNHAALAASMCNNLNETAEAEKEEE